MATRKRSSAVWEFFDESVVATELRKDGKEIKKIRCRLCDLKLLDGGGTSNLSSHLQAKHPEQYRRISGGSTSSQRQTTLTGTSRICSAQRSAVISEKIVEFVARDLGHASD